MSNQYEVDLAKNDLEQAYDRARLILDLETRKKQFHQEELDLLRARFLQVKGALQNLYNTVEHLRQVVSLKEHLEKDDAQQRAGIRKQKFDRTKNLFQEFAKSNMGITEHLDKLMSSAITRNKLQHTLQVGSTCTIADPTDKTKKVSATILEILPDNTLKVSVNAPGTSRDGEEWALIPLSDLEAPQDNG